MATSLQVAPGATVPLNDLTSMSRDVEAGLDDVWRRLVDSSAFIGGPWVERFEAAWARYCGTKHAIGVANGTDALEITLRALGIGPGDEVIVPANTFVATAEAVVLAGATPRFIDVDPLTLLLTPDEIESAVNERTAAVIAVELFGNMPNMDAIAALTDRLGLALIEDAAQAHGATWKGKPAGSFGVAGCFSFYPGKNLGAFGDGGAVVTDDEGLALRIRSIADHGRALDSRYVHVTLGRNSRLDALQAGILSVKLKRLDAWNEARRGAIDAYRLALDPEVVPMISVDAHVQSAYHLNVVLVNDRDSVRDELSDRGIETGIHYPVPCHLERPYRGLVADRLPVVENAASRLLSLPLFPHMSLVQIDRVCMDVMKIAARGRRRA
jgi:dTDP-4-amino-4,6-dideoxygalactose transaminase